MSKKIISIVMSLIVVTSLTGCGSTGSKTSTDSTSSTESTTTSEDDSLTGTWATNYNLEELKKLYEEKLEKIKEITEDAGITAEEDERITNEDDSFISDNALYFDNDGAETNKIENFYFGQKLYGEDSSQGVIELKIILNFDGDSAVSSNFNMKDTTMAKYIAAFTGDDSRDYTSINNEILEKLKAGETQVTITNTIDGLKEEIIVTNDTFFYKLSTKKYDFTNADNSTIGTTTNSTESETDDNNTENTSSDDNTTQNN